MLKIIKDEDRYEILLASGHCGHIYPGGDGYYVEAYSGRPAEAIGKGSRRDQAYNEDLYTLMTIQKPTLAVDDLKNGILSIVWEFIDDHRIAELLENCIRCTINAEKMVDWLVDYSVLSAGETIESLAREWWLGYSCIRDPDWLYGAAKSARLYPETGSSDRAELFERLAEWTKNEI